MLDIRVISIVDCPNAAPTVERVRNAVDRLDVDASVRVTVVDSMEDAQRFRFLGSPSVQIDGRDIEVSRRTDPALFGCRLYDSDGSKEGVPSDQMIGDAIREALGMT